MKKQGLIYFVSECKDSEYAYEITVQRDGQEPQINTRYPKKEQLNECIGLALKLAISAKHDYGNSNVKLVIEPDICSISEPMISI
jgi:hypothetical protein